MTFVMKAFDELTPSEVYEILKARCEVFFLEQHIVCQDMDDVDYQSLHFFIKDGKTVLAYLRAYEAEDDLDTIVIGRVLTLCHGEGLGRELMEKGIVALRTQTNRKRITLHAQVQAEGFYQKCGFQTVSDVFMEEGIPHVTMERML